MKKIDMRKMKLIALLGALAIVTVSGVSAAIIAARTPDNCAYVPGPPDAGGSISTIECRCNGVPTPTKWCDQGWYVTR